MKLIFSPSAVCDLQKISDYTIETWGQEQEDRYLRGLWKKFAEIQSNPESYRLREDLAKECRSARHDRHVIFFSVKGPELQIIRILHGAMDFNRYLTGEDLPQ